MGEFENYIDSILNGKYISSTRKEGLKSEMLDHLNLSKAELIEEGLDEGKAEAESIRRFGEALKIRREFKSVFNPYIRLRNLLERNKMLKESIEWTFTILVALFISMTVRSYVFAQTEVRQSSMQNTLFEGQRLIENKLGYLFSAPQRGDIVIIYRNAPKGLINTFELNTTEFFKGFFDKKDVDKKRLIKRIIGIPGDTIDVHDGKVFINGKETKEAYTKGTTETKGMKFPVKIPAKEYFVLGDNREVSLDSRMLGLINADDIEGKASFRLWPFDKIGSIYK